MYLLLYIVIFTWYIHSMPLRNAFYIFILFIVFIFILFKEKSFKFLMFIICFWWNGNTHSVCVCVCVRWDDVKETSSLFHEVLWWVETYRTCAAIIHNASLIKWIMMLRFARVKKIPYKEFTNGRGGRTENKKKSGFIM